MKKHFTAWLLITSAIGIAFFNNPPDGRTGAPGDQSCSSGSCHNSAGANHTANVAISGFPTVLNGGETYTINLTASHGGIIPANPRLGFQLVVLDENNDNIGTLNNPAPQATLTASGGRTYAEHNPGQNSSNTTWTVDFTAPASSSSQEVTVYATANVANGNGNSSGDIIREVTMSAGLQATSDPLIVDVNKIMDVSCNGGEDGSAEVIASGGPTGNYTYEWDNGEFSAVATMLNAGLHTVTVTDQSEIVVESILINEPELLEGSITEQQNPSCNDVRNGSITAEAEGGTEPYSYEWNTGAIGNVLRNVFGGDYSVTITDANDCTVELNATLETPDPITLNFETEPPLCHNSADGTIRVAGSGGTGPIFYEWDNGETGDVLSNLSGGIYSVMAMDDNGCLIEDSVELIAPDPIQIDLQAGDLLCAGDSLTGITADVTGGTGELSLEWSTGSDSLSSGPVGAGTYSLTVTDENACMAAAEIEIEEPSPLSNIIDTDPPFCPNDSSGVISLNPMGGTPPYSFNWSHTQIDTNFLSNLGGGTYRFTITDSRGCSLSDSVVFDIPAPISYSLEVNDETGLNRNDGSASLSNISGGYAPYFIRWSTGDTTLAVDDLMPGMYSFTIIDTNICEVSEDFTVEAFECTLSLGFEVQDPLCFQSCDGRIELLIDGANDPVDIVSPIELDGLIADSLCADSYSLIAEDASGCKDSVEVELMDPMAILIQIDSVRDANSDQMGAIYATIMGGTGELTVNLLDSQDSLVMTLTNEDDFLDLDAGTYTIVVIDENGCERQSIEIQVDLIENNAENSALEEISIYPNPVNQFVQVKISTPGLYSVKLYETSTGRMVLKESFEGQQSTIDLTKFTKGSYFLEVENEKGFSVVNKILKL